ncbi:MAG: hypothetical protein V3V41_07835 [Candidatus Heimdallarchaeota archaeon]
MVDVVDQNTNDKSAFISFFNQTGDTGRITDQGDWLQFGLGSATGPWLTDGGTSTLNMPWVNEFIAQFAVKLVQGGTSDSTLWLHISDGTNAFRLGVNVKSFQLEWDNGTTPITNSPNGADDLSFTISSSFVWYRIRLLSNGTIEMQTAGYTEGSKTASTAWTTRATHTLTHALGQTISEIRIQQYFGTSQHAGLSYVHAYGDAGGSGNLLGGAATITNDVSTIVTDMIGGGGTGKILEFLDPHTDLSTNVVRIIANNRKTVTITDPFYNVIHFKGEIVDYDIKRDHVIYEVESAERKLNDVFANHNAVLLISEIKRIHQNIIHDYNSASKDAVPGSFWTPNEFDNKLIVFGDRDYYVVKVHPNTITWKNIDARSTRKIGLTTVDNMTGGTFKSIDGVVGNLYYNNQSRLSFNTAAAIYDYSPPVGSSTSTDAEINADLQFNPFLKTTALFSEVRLKIIVRHTSLRDTHLSQSDSISEGRPIIRLTQTDGTTQDLLYIIGLVNQFSEVEDFDDSKTNFLNGGNYNLDDRASPIYTVDIDMLVELDISFATFKTNYLVEVTSQNSSGFTEYKLNVVLYSGLMEITTVKDCKIEIYEASIEFKHGDTIQSQEIGTQSISVSGTTTITIDTGGGDYIANAPEADGIVAGDKFWITTDVKTAFAAALAAGTLNGIIGLDTTGWTGADNFGVTDDWTHTKLLAILQRQSEIHNLITFFDPNDSKQYITKVPGLVSTGIIFTSEDIIGYKQNVWVYSKNSKNIKETIIGIGAEGVTHTVTNSPEFADGWGDEQKIYRNPEIASKKSIKEYTINKAKLHVNATVYAEFSISLTAPKNYYGTVRKGRTVGLQLPTVADSSIANHTNANAELLIVSVTFQSINNERTMRITLRDRNA